MLSYLPKLETLLLVGTFGQTLRFFGPNWLQLSLTLTISAITLTILKVALIIRQRYENHKIFDKGNIPSVDNKNPFSGNLFQVIAPRDNMKVMLNYHKKLGKNVGMFYGQDPWVLSTDLDLLYRIFGYESHKYVDKAQLKWPFKKELDKSLAQIQGNDWRRSRKILNPSFAQKQMKSDNVYKDIEETCEKFLSCIDGYPVETDNEKSGTRGRHIDIVYNSHKFTVDILFKIAFAYENGVNFSPRSRDEILDAVHKIAKLLKGPGLFISIMFSRLRPILNYLIQFTALGSYVRYMKVLILKSLVKRQRMIKQANGDNNNNHNYGHRKMIDSIIESAKHGQMDDETVMANLYFFFLAGFETSANTVASFLWLLARHPEIQEKLRESIKAEGENSTYLDWCVKESLRLFPAVPSGIGRILHEDTETSLGQTIFAGTTLMIDIYSIHHSEEYWGPDVEEFKPERFAEMDKMHPAQYVPFSLGIRNCPGKSLAISEVKAIASRLLVKYRLESNSKTPEAMDWVAPNLVHMILEGPISVTFVELEK